MLFCFLFQIKNFQNYLFTFLYIAKPFTNIILIIESIYLEITTCTISTKLSQFHPTVSFASRGCGLCCLLFCIMWNLLFMRKAYCLCIYEKNVIFLKLRDWQVKVNCGWLGSTDSYCVHGKIILKVWLQSNLLTVLSFSSSYFPSNEIVYQHYSYLFNYTLFSF